MIFPHNASTNEHSSMNLYTVLRILVSVVTCNSKPDTFGTYQSCNATSD